MATEVTMCDLHPGSDLPCVVCAEQLASREQARRNRVLQGFRDIQIGTRYQGKTFADYHPTCPEAAEVKAKCQRYAENFAARLAGCDSILMLGNPGTGKNMLSACICQHITTQGHTALHTTAMKVVRKIKTAWGNSDLDEQTLIDGFTKPDLLVIDEIGKQFGSKTEENLLFEVINGRYEDMRPTILISNLGLDGIEEYLGPHAVDRFYEGKSSLMNFSWDSYRRRG